MLCTSSSAKAFYIWRSDSFMLCVHENTFVRSGVRVIWGPSAKVGLQHKWKYVMGFNRYSPWEVKSIAETCDKLYQLYGGFCRLFHVFVCKNVFGLRSKWDEAGATPSLRFFGITPPPETTPGFTSPLHDFYPNTIKTMIASLSSLHVCPT
jgi:hypothetical protein